jgi:Fic family protein
LRREAQSTSALEGTYAPFVDVLAADLDDAATMPTEVREVLNFERIAEEAFAWPVERPITLGVLGELQRMLVRGTPGELTDARGLRDRIVVVGRPGSSLAEARFVPPPPGDQLKAGAEDLLHWMNNPPNIPTVLQAAMAHYQFETLHPYSDGNGRLGRLLAIVQLLRGEVIREPLLVVSPWFERRRELYQDALLDLSSTGAWDPWVTFFAKGVAASASESQQKVERLVGLGEELRCKVGAAGKRGAAERLAGELVGAPYVTAPEVAKVQKLTWQGATNAIQTLVGLGILEPVGYLRHGTATYVAPAVVNSLVA